MLILQAPLPGLTTTTVLPSPQFNDAQAKQHGVTIKRAIDGTRYTHIHTTDGRHKLTYQVAMSRMKALELRAFVQAYYRSQIRLTNHKGEVWRVWFVNNPFEFETLERAEGQFRGQPGGEWVSLTIEWVGGRRPALRLCGSEDRRFDPGPDYRDRQHFYWPLTTEVEVVVTARQTLAIPDQVMVTKDGKKVVVKTLVVYRIPDPVRAIGKLNWDCDTTINDLTQSAVIRVVATHTYDEIMKGIADESLTTILTKETRRELRQFGVHVTRCKLVDFADCKVFKLLTSQADRQGMSTHQFYN